MATIIVMIFPVAVGMTSQIGTPIERQPVLARKAGHARQTPALSRKYSRDKIFSRALIVVIFRREHTLNCQQVSTRGKVLRR